MSYSKITRMFTIAFLFAFALIALALLVWNKINIPASTPVEVRGLKGEAYEKNIEVVSHSAAVIDTPEPREKLLEDETIRIGLQYLSSRGYVDPEQRDVYRNYDIATLSALGDDGDLIALSVLGEIYSGTDKWAQGLEIWQKASMFGAVNTGMALAGWHSGQSRVYAELDAELSRQALIEGLGWLEFVELRGGSPSLESERKRILSESQTVLSSEVLKAGRERGIAIYEGLSLRRKEHGLAPFDNTIPEDAKPFLKMVSESKL